MEWAPEPADLQEDVEFIRSLHRELETDWLSKQGADTSEALESSLAFVPHFKRILRRRTKFPLEVVQPLCQLMLDIIMAAREDLFAMTEWALTLKQLLRRYVLREMEWEVQWRPLFNLLDSTLLKKSHQYISPMIRQSLQNNLPDLIRDLRHFFPSGSASEIWAECSPALENYHSEEAFLALSQLALFLPLDHWDRVTHCSTWDATWLYLFARLAKHDTHGLVNWSPLLPRLYCHVGWVFRLPIGSATADPPFGKVAVQAVKLMHHHRSTDAARLAIRLLQQVPMDPPCERNDSSAADGGADGAVNGDARERTVGRAALVHLQTLAALIDTYFHPSNSGPWSSTLEGFLTKFSQLVVLLLTPPWARARGATRGPPGGRGDRQQQHRATLPAQSRDVLEDLVIGFASHAEFSKNEGLSAAGIDALLDAAYYAPDKALPLIITRFEVALINVSASQQLNTAIQSLATAVRPLLAIGLPAHPDAMDIDGDCGPSKERAARQERAADMIASSLQALLPAIDANDEDKSLNCLNYFCIVLSSLPTFPESGQPGVLPLDLETWAEAVVGRCMVIVEAMETPDNRSADRHSGSDADLDSFFLLGTELSMYRQMLELLFARLQLPALKRTMVRLAKWATSTILPSVDLEAGTMIAAAATANPELAASLLLEPLLVHTEREVAAVVSSLHADHPDQLSKVQQASLRWDLSLLRHACLALGPHMLSLAPRIVAVLQAAFAIPYKAAQNTAYDLLASLLNSTALFYPLDHNIPYTSPCTDPGQVEPWYDKLEWTQRAQPRWHLPSKEEEAFNMSLVETFLLQPAAALVGAANEIGVTARWLTVRGRIRSLLCQMIGVMEGALTCLPDLHGTSDVAGWRMGPSLGSPSVRQAAIEAVAALFPVIPPFDSETLSLASHVAVIAVDGAHLLEDVANDSDSCVHSGMVLSTEPWSARLLDIMDREAAEKTEGDGIVGSPGSGKWRHRMPKWLNAQRGRARLEWRVVTARQQPGTSPTRPSVPLCDVPPCCKALLGALLPTALAPFLEAREAAKEPLWRLLKLYPSALAPLVLPPLLLGLCGITESCDDKPTISEEGVTWQLLERLLSIVPSSGNVTNDDVAVEGLVQGAVAALQVQPLWRFISRDALAFAAASAVMVAACREGSRESASNVSVFSMSRLLMMSPPPRAAPPQVCDGNGRAPTQAVIEKLLDLVQLPAVNWEAPQPLEGGASGIGLHWRKALIADALLMVLAPMMPPGTTAAHVAHMTNTLRSEISSRRDVASIVLPALLQPSLTESALQTESGQRVRATIEGLLGQPGFASAILSCSAHAHPGARAEGSKRDGARVVSKEEAAASCLASFFWVLDTWPQRRTSSCYFSIANARMWQALATAAPVTAVAALQEPLTVALQGSQSDDRPTVLAAIEAISGLLAAQAPFSEGKQQRNPWSDWLGPLLGAALERAPLDCIDCWAAAVRFAVAAMCRSSTSSSDAHAAMLFQLASQPAPNGVETPSASIIKRMRLTRQMLLELSTQHVLSPLPARADHLSSASNDGEIDQGGVTSDRGIDREMPSARSFLQAVLGELQTLAALPSAALQEEVAGVASIACGLALMSGAAASSCVISAHSFCATIEGILVESADIIQSVEGSIPNRTPIKLNGEANTSNPEELDSLLATDGIGEDAGEQDQTIAFDMAIDPVKDDSHTVGSGKVGPEVTARLGLALSFLKRIMSLGDGALFRPLILRCLAPLLLLQVLKLPELQRLQIVSRTALAMMKQLPLGSTAAAVQAVGIVSSTSKAHLWTARASALGWAQVFWFRHAFLLPSDAIRTLQAVVEGMLEDSKLEVGSFAAATLVGFLRVATPSEATAFRSRYLAALSTHSKRNKRRRPADPILSENTSGVSAPIGRHSAVLGLRAAAACAPYSIPPWLPEVLVSLAAAAADVSPTGKAARATLADFRRTHEPAALAEARLLLGAEGWEAITEIEGGREGGFA